MENSQKSPSWTPHPIVAGYKWIFYSSINGFFTPSILNDSLSLVQLLESHRFDKNCFFFTINFKSLYTNILVDDVINSIRKLCFDYQNTIPNAHFIIELLDLVLNSRLMVFEGKYFKKKLV